MSKVGYLAGPMRHHFLLNWPAFDANAKYLRDLGWTIFSPADIDREEGVDPTRTDFSDAEFKCFMRRDYDAILQCDAIIFMPGWEASVGANLERKFGAMLGLDFYRVDADQQTFEKEQIIALAGFAQSGKDTLADQLVRRLGFERRGFADALKDVLYAINPYVIVNEGSHYVCPNDSYEFPAHDDVRLQDLIRILADNFGGNGWDEAKNRYPEVRELLQRLGTEGGRENIADDVWVRALLDKPHGPRLVISDCRFPNEYAAVKARGGTVVRIHREGYFPANSHISETALQEQDFIIDNDGTPEDLLLQFAAVTGLYQDELMVSA